MEETKKNNSKVGLIIFLILIILGLAGYICYDKFFSKKEPAKIEKECDNSNFLQDDFTAIIDEELDILLGMKSTSNITNEQMTIWAYTNVSNDLPSTQHFSASALDDYIKNSSLRKLNYKLTNIYDWYGNYAYVDDYICLKLENGEYNVTDTPCGHGFTFVSPQYSKVVGLEHKCNEYIVSVKNVFTYGGDGGPSNQYFYAFDDAYNYYMGSEDIKPFYEVDFETDYGIAKELANNYITENWDTIKDKLETYKYTFEIVDGDIVLKDFERIPAGK